MPSVTVALLTLLVLLAGGAPAAHAGFYTGNEIVTKLDEYEARQPSIHAAHQAGLYAGYTAGAFDMLAASRIICPQGKVTTVQVNSIVAKYLRARPELLNQEAAALVRAALESAFPCGTSLRLVD